MPIRETPWPAGTPCWVDCQVDDPGRARDFYGALFGWEVAGTAPEAGGYLMAMVQGRSAAGIGPKPPGQVMRSTWTTYLASDDADATAAAVSAAGGTVLAPPFDVMDIGRMLVAADPTGAVFGVWQARKHFGAGIYNEPGAYCWNELHTAGYEQAQNFYSTVFGWHFTEVGDGENMVYATFALEPGGDPVGGFNDSTRTPDAGPPHWLAWFQVSDTDATLNSATGLGASVLMGAQDSPFGRMGVLAAPQGEAFGVIDIAQSTAPE
ncbi:VOC family protein [Nocardia carnea]|uniref:VOC family protein n=1 Tax=Nocardia carnea TaxID=37328 RepID=UPI002453FB86|nr:VOC family protein [Nocardia carnea]